MGESGSLARTHEIVTLAAIKRGALGPASGSSKSLPARTEGRPRMKCKHIPARLSHHFMDAVWLAVACHHQANAQSAPRAGNLNRTMTAQSDDGASKAMIHGPN